MKIKTPRILLIATLTAVIILLSHANATHFRQLSVNEGLSQPTGTAVAQDCLGRIWIGTREGVNIYDGTSITGYQGWVPSGKERVWIGNVVSTIASDSVGNIFLLIDNDIIRYDIAGERFSRFTNSGSVSALAPFKGKIVYVSADSLFVKNAADDRTEFLFRIPEARNITGIAIGEKAYYISSSSGLHIYDRKSLKHNILLPEKNIYSLYISQDKSLWFSSASEGIYCLRPGTAEPEFKSAPAAINGNKGPVETRNIIEDTNGDIWYGAFSGLYRYEPESGKTHNIALPTNTENLSHSSVIGMLCDRAGNIWAGTYYGGVNYFRPNRADIINFDYERLAPEGMHPSCVVSIVKDKRGNIWFGTDGAGVVCVDTLWNIRKQLNTRSGADVIRQNNIKDLAYDSISDRLFIGTHLGGISVYDITRKKLTNLIDCPDNGHYSSIIADFEIHGRKLFIASKPGLSYIDLDDNSNKQHIISKTINLRRIGFDSKNNLCGIGRSDNTVYKIKTDTPRMQISILARLNEKGAKASDLCCLEGGILISTLGNGIIWVPDPDFKKNDVRFNSTFPDKYCYAIAKSTEGDVYILGSRHISQFSPITGRIESISFSDYFQNSNLINGCGMLPLKNGTLLVGSTKGITLFDEQSVFSGKDDHERIFFSQLRVDSRTVSASDSTGILNKALPFAETISLPYDHPDFEIQIGVSNYTANSQRPVIEYRLSGHDETWHITRNGVIRYVDLKPGIYTLSSRIAGAKDVIEIKIEVAHPWYSSWWAWLLYIIAGISIISFIIYKTNDASHLRISLGRLLDEHRRQRLEDARTFPPESVENPLDKKFITDVSRYIENHISDTELDIQAICQDIGMSRTLFFNKFKTLTGDTPNAFILRCRLKHSATLLKTCPHMNVTEIAEDSGFNNAAYFSRCFKKKFGVSPLAYRKNSDGPVD